LRNKEDDPRVRLYRRVDDQKVHKIMPAVYLKKKYTWLKGKKKTNGVEGGERGEAPEGQHDRELSIEIWEGQ